YTRFAPVDSAGTPTIESLSIPHDFNLRPDKQISNLHVKAVQYLLHCGSILPDFRWNCILHSRNSISQMILTQ
ncbi:hypothetical protein PMAYCL1PPCAC_16781, partial [Pristionchus mayeri]